MSVDLVSRLRRIPDAVMPVSFDVEHVLRRGHRRRGRKRVAVAATVLAVIAAGASSIPLVGSRTVLLERLGDNLPAATTPSSAGTAATRDWRTHTLTALDGSVVEIYGPPQLGADGATIIGTVAFESAALEFTAGGPSYATFVRTWEGLELGAPLRHDSGGALRAGQLDATSAVALWEGDFYTMSTTSGSLDVSGLIELISRVGILERRGGLVLDLGAVGVFDDVAPPTVHQPLPGVGSLEVRPEPSSASLPPSGRPEQVSGGLLFEQGDGSLVLVTDSARASLTPSSPATLEAARRVATELRISWEPPS